MTKSRGAPVPRWLGVVAKLEQSQRECCRILLRVSRVKGAWAGEGPAFGSPQLLASRSYAL